jgi:hypothetical protein
MVNGGQVCVCPDYVFVPDDQLETFVDVARQTLRGMFPNIVSNDDYCSSVNQANFDRVLGLIEDARVKGATVETIAPEQESLPDRAKRKIAPTIVRDIDDRMKIADEEIFGPVLAVKGYSRLAPVRRRGPQRDGGIPRQGGLRHIEPKPNCGRQRSTVQHYRIRGPAIRETLAARRKMPRCGGARMRVHRRLMAASRR